VEEEIEPGNVVPVLGAALEVGVAFGEEEELLDGLEFEFD
jgi:hypothetical protein